MRIALPPLPSPPATAPSCVALALSHLTRLLIVLLALQVREDACLLHLPLEAAKHPLEIVTLVDDYLYHDPRFTSSVRRRRRRRRVQLAARRLCGIPLCVNAYRADPCVTPFAGQPPSRSETRRRRQRSRRDPVRPGEPQACPARKAKSKTCLQLRDRPSSCQIAYHPGAGGQNNPCTPPERLQYAAQRAQKRLPRGRAILVINC